MIRVSGLVLFWTFLFAGSDPNRMAAIQASHLDDAIEVYKLENGEYPALKPGFEVLGGYLQTVDPWGQEFRHYVTKNGELRVFSCGADLNCGTSDDVNAETKVIEHSGCFVM